MAILENTIQRILVINPNTSTSITETFRPVLEDLLLPKTFEFSYWTCPTGPAIITSMGDMYESVSHCLPLLLELAPYFDGFLAACYADHPLVRLLQAQIPDKPVVGIFDASIFAALQLVSPGSRFGILTTGHAYEALLTDGVTTLLENNVSALDQFAGVVASGIGLKDLETDACPEQSVARVKIVKATQLLLQSEARSDVDVICMGGVILIGMERWVHEASQLTWRHCTGRRIRVVDQLAAGMLTLEALLSSKSLENVDYSRSLR